MKNALKENDFKKIGNLMEKNTLLMHETTKYCNPSFSYITKESKEIIKNVRKIRENGLNIYFTMDAGPNVKILYLQEDEEKVLNILNSHYEGKILLC